MNALYHAKVALCLTVICCAGYATFRIVPAVEGALNATEEAAKEAKAVAGMGREALPEIGRHVDQQIKDLRIDMTKLVDDARNDVLSKVNGQADALRSDMKTLADERLRPITDTAVNQINQIGKDASGTLAASSRLIGRYERIPDDVALNTRPLWDCREYSGCVTSQSLALIGSARATLGVVARNAPRMADHAERIAGDSENISRNIGLITYNFAEATRVPPLWQRVLLRWAPAGAQIATPFVVGK